MRPRDVGVLAVLVLTGFLLQVSVLPLVAGGGFAPDLLLVLTVVLVLEHGTRVGLWVAGSAGLLLDLASATLPLGSSMLVLVTLVYLVGLVRPYLAERAELTTAVLAGVAGVVSVLGQAAIAALLSTTAVSPRVVGGSALVVGAFAVLLAPPVLRVVQRTLPVPETLASEVAP